MDVVNSICLPQKYKKNSIFYYVSYKFRNFAAD